MSDKWVTESSGLNGSDSIISQISQLPNAVKRLRIGFFMIGRKIYLIT